MILCLDVGNSNLVGYIFKVDTIILQFRCETNSIGTQDQIGLFMLNALREAKINPLEITKIGISSVVPSVDSILEDACSKYLNTKPLFLKFGLKTGLPIKTSSPTEVGSDLIAGSIAAKHLYPQQHILIFDFGTASTCSYIDNMGALIGVSITLGIHLMLQALTNNTAKLFSTQIETPKEALGKTTTTSIQAGIYYTQLGFIKETIIQIMKERKLTKPIIIATGGLSYLFKHEHIFTTIVSELIALGIKLVLEQN